MPLLGLALAALTGVSLGLLGASGSVLTVPILVYVLGYTPKQAIPMNLVIVGATSIVGVVSHWRLEHVRVRFVLTFGAVAMIGAYTTSHFRARLLSESAQLLLLGCRCTDGQP